MLAVLMSRHLSAYRSVPKSSPARGKLKSLIFRNRNIRQKEPKSPWFDVLESKVQLDDSTTRILSET